MPSPSQPIVKDKLGQVISLGDVVIGSSGSDVHIGIVTRFGARNNVQIGNGSFTAGSYIVRITEQYIQAQGQKSYDDFKDKFKITTEPVKVSKPAVTYVIAKVLDKTKPTGASSYDPTKNYACDYYVVEIIGSRFNERNDSWVKRCNNPLFNQSDAYRIWVSRASRLVDGVWVRGNRLRYGYFNVHDGFSRKRLREIHPELDRWVNQKITDPNIITILDSAIN